MSHTLTFAELPGAVLGDAHSAPQHYGNPVREQRSLESGAAVVSLEHHEIVTVSGPDRLSWLHSMTSQRLTGLAAGESVESLLLDPNGRIERVMRVVDDGDTTWLLVDEGEAEPLTAFLTRMRFALRVEIENVSDRFAPVLVMGDGAAQTVRDTVPIVVDWRDPWADGVVGGVQYAAVDHAGASWNAIHLVIARENLGMLVDLISRGSLQAAGTLALQALEVRAWRPNHAADTDERSLPHEFDWMRTAVHLNKGCYRGQETVAKVHNLGHPPRRLVLLHLDGSAGELPAAGALIYPAGAAMQEEARPVGRITRAVMHHEWGAIALALVKRNVAAEAPLEVPAPDGVTVIAANQEIIVPVTAGQTRDIPKLRRL